MRNTRFYDDAYSAREALEYYRQRAIQFLADGWSWDGTYRDHGWGIDVGFKHDATRSVRYVSVYVFSEYVGQGCMTRWLATMKNDFASGKARFITSDQCGKMKRYLERKKVPFRLIQPDYWAWPEYHAISEHYGQARAKRSGQFLIQHIEEGISLLRKLGSTEDAQRAFCLHPLVQSDVSIRNCDPAHLMRVHDFSPWAVALAMEYRHVANGHLRGHKITDPREIKLGPLSEVADMLRADKIQNRKDFRRHLMASHPKAWELERYYIEWLDRLDVTHDMYEVFVRHIDIATAVDGYRAIT